MHIGRVVVGVIGIVAGAVWILQGSGVIPGSFMTGQRMWLVIGIVVAIVGLGIAYIGIRGPAKP